MSAICNESTRGADASVHCVNICCKVLVWRMRVRSNNAMGLLTEVRRSVTQSAPVFIEHLCLILPITAIMYSVMQL